MNTSHDQIGDSRKPWIGITSDLMVRNDRPTSFLTMTYVHAIERAGGVPVVLASGEQSTKEYLDRLDGFLLSGGDDPVMESFGATTHACSTRVLDARQGFETGLLNELHRQGEIPVLGVCLGMQMMALCRNGKLNQHLPETHETHQLHWEHAHEIKSDRNEVLGDGIVWSKHRQAVSDPGDLEVIARSDDGIIEAIYDPDHPFYLGVQWHPERTKDPILGDQVIQSFVDHARNGMS